MENVIEVEGLTQRFGDLCAVKDFSFSVQKGEVLALLGPNGAGKTTTIRLINGLFMPTSGKVRVMGLDPISDGDQVRRLTGVLTETPALYERLTAWQNLAFFGTLTGMSKEQWQRRGEELLSFFGLEGRSHERVGVFSKGMKQRLALVRALLHNPPVLFLDEPTAGLDPEAALQVHELIRSIRKSNGQTLVLCTHNLLEAERLCDRMAILQRGEMLALGGMDDLRRKYAQGVWVRIELLLPAAAEMFNALASRRGVLGVKMEDNLSLDVHVQAEDVIPDLVAWLVEQGARLVAVRPQEVSLEEIYFKLQDQARGGRQ